jgi:hypothetical protein
MEDMKDKQCRDCEIEAKKHCDECGGYGSEHICDNPSCDVVLENDYWEAFKDEGKVMCCSGCEEDEIDEEKFLAKYIVPNYYLPEHLEDWGVMPSEIEGFKDFVIKWGRTGEMNIIMRELLEHWRESPHDLD